MLKNLLNRVETIEKSLVEPKKEEKIEKSEKNDEQKQIREEIEQLKKSNKELMDRLNKPTPRKTVSNIDYIEKGQPARKENNFNTKQDVIERLEELMKSGKVHGDDIIRFNASGVLSERAKKALME